MSASGMMRPGRSNGSALRQTMFFGLLLRVSALIFLLTVGLKFSEPFFLSDDRAYEELAQAYLCHADELFDLHAFRYIGAAGYLQVFYPALVCFAGYAMRTVYAGRILNVLFSTLCIRQIYHLTVRLSGNHDTALRAARLFAYLPVTVLTCCFPIKDIFLTYAVLYLFHFIVQIQQGVWVHLPKLLYCAVLAVAVYLTRGVVAEALLLILGVMLLYRFWKKSHYLMFALCLALELLVAFLLRGYLIYAVQGKISVYGGSMSQTDLTAIISRFPMRDLSVMLLLVAVFYFFRCARNSYRWSAAFLAVCVVFALGTYFTAGWAAELICVVFFFFLLFWLCSQKEYLSAAVALVLATIVTFLLIYSVWERGGSFLGKPTSGDRLLGLMPELWKFVYRLPFNYFFATLQPFKLGWYDQTVSTWMWVISMLNITIYPIAIGNFFYIFHAKKNLLFWLATFGLYIGVISLSLGISRHYLFLLPVEIVNFSLYREKADPREKQVGFLLLLGLLMLASAYSMIR